MRKILFVIALTGLSLTAFAQYQTEVPTKKHSVQTNSFWSNWFVQLGGGYGLTFSDQETNNGKTNPSTLPEIGTFSSKRGAPSIGLAVGKWFTPGIAVRLKGSGIWGKRVGIGEKMYSDINAGSETWNADHTKWLEGTGKWHNADTWDNGRTSESITQFDLQAQVMFNLSNLIYGYNPTRLWNLNVLAGAGTMHCSTDRSAWAFDYTAGINSVWHVSKHFDVFAEGGLIFANGDADGFDYDGKTYWQNNDKKFYAEAGIVYNFGKRVGWDKTVDLEAVNALHQSQIDALNEQLEDANAENSRLKQLLFEAQRRPEPETKKIREIVSAPISVFFNINKATPASNKDLVNLKDLADMAKEINGKITVTGYADSATGSPEYNKKLSEARANNIADKLVEMGVARDNITTVAEGGVEALSPVSYNRRATVKITE